MKKYFYLMAATIMVLGFTACTDDNIVNPTPTASAEQPVTQTEDAVSVKVDGSYVVYGELEHGFDQALQRRLQGNMTSPVNADCFVFDVAALFESSLSVDEWKDVVRRCSAGDASFLITHCTFKEFYNFAVLYYLGMVALELDNFQGDTDPAAEAEAEARAKRFMANVVRNAYMARTQADGTMTRGTEVNGQELDWENIRQWPEEKQNAVMFDAYAYSGGNEIYVLNSEAGKYISEEVGEQPENNYGWGQKADAIADWLNRQRKQDDAETRAGLVDFTRAVTRAGGNTAISDLMSAQTKEFVFDYSKPSLWHPGIETFYSAIKVLYSVYSAYDFGGNVEYYQVRQNITIMNDKIYDSPGGDSWWSRIDDGKWVLARGAYMKSIDTKMWLEGSGTKSVISAAPLNENGSSSGSSSSGGSASTTIGSSNGVSIGITGGMSAFNPTFTATSTYTHTESYSETTGTTWNTSTNWNTKDLTTVFTQGNDANATVTWKHTGYTPTNGNDAHVSKLKPLLRSTCVTDEQTLWKVENPSGTYTLKASLNVVSEIYKITLTGSEGAKPTLDNPHDISFDLTAPNRYKRMWNNVIYDYGSITGDIQLTHYLDEYIESAYGYNSANFCWAGLFLSTEATADGSDNACSVFQTFKNSLRGMKQQLRVKGFRGRLVFGLKPNGKEELTDSLVIDLGTNYVSYGIGETLIEQVNGYDLTFKVTNANNEVELTNVPNDFSGELNIPATIAEGNLTLTSLGNNCAVGRKGITAVTIPSTVRTIENGALAGLDKITSIDIPEGVQTISTWVFNEDKEVTEVWLPSTLKTVGGCAFMNMDKLTQIHIKATTPPELGNLIFYPRYDKATLYVPTGCKNTYANAKEWWYFKNIVEE